MGVGEDLPDPCTWRPNRYCRFKPLHHALFRR
jgi:hypothetical protein